MQNIHPPDGLSIADLAQIDLGRLQVLVSQNDLGNNLQRHPISAGIRGGMPAEIMGRYFDIQLPTQSGYHIPDRGIAERKHPMCRRHLPRLNILGQSGGNVFRHEGNLCIPSRLRFLDEQFSA